MVKLGKHRSPILVFGGAYSNLAATQAMKLTSEKLGIPPGRIICTGDLVAYCAEPAQTVSLIKDWGIHVVMGNCEESIGFDEPDCGCGFDEGSVCAALSANWYRYAAQFITADTRSWMRALPREIQFEIYGTRYRVVHGSVSSINQFIFPSSPDALKLSEIALTDSSVIIGGHSGIPFGQKIDDNYWLNAGVIGMPANDGTADGWYMLIDSEDATVRVSWHRLPYDALESQRTTRGAGMGEYADALVSGRWPSLDILPHKEKMQTGQKLSLEPLEIY